MGRNCQKGNPSEVNTRSDYSLFHFLLLKNRDKIPSFLMFVLATLKGF